MRVLHLIRTDGIGGAERVLLRGLPALRAQGVDATLGLLDPTEDTSNPVYQEARRLQIPTERLLDRGRISPSHGLHLASWCKRERFDLLHVHGYRAAMYGLPAARWARCPIVTTRHGLLSRNHKERLAEHLERAIANRMDAVLPVATHLATSIRARCQVLTNGIPLPPLDACANPQELPRRLLFVGRLSPEKDVSLLIKTMELLHPRWPDLQLDIVGEGPLLFDLQQQTMAAGLTKNITFHGFCDPQAFYRRADILAISSQREGLPLVALEAMASQLPVISTSVGGLPALLAGASPGGLLVPHATVHGYAETLAQLLLCPGLARQLGRQARSHIEAHYSLEQWARAHVNLYRELTA